MLFMLTIDTVKFSAGYLICVPMLDEWRTEEGIQPLDGWTFQVSHLSSTASNFKFHNVAVLIGVRGAHFTLLLSLIFNFKCSCLLQVSRNEWYVDCDC